MAYNGWTNYETWNVSLWIDNDPGSYAHWTDRAEELVADAFDDDETDEDIRNEAASKLADEIAVEHQENMPETSGTYADLLGAALDAVNWLEIAEHMVAEVSIVREPKDEEAA